MFAREMERSKTAIRVGLLGTVLLLARPAWAVSTPSSLSWTQLPGAESCIGATALAKRIESRLGRQVFVSPAAAKLSVEGLIEPNRSGRGFRARLRATDDHGKEVGNRSLEVPGPDCSAIDAPLTLVIALMVDPDAALSPEPVKPPEPICPAPEVKVEHLEIIFERSDRPPQRADRWRFALRSAALVGSELMPGTVIGATLAASVTPPSFWPLELGVSWFAPARQRLDGGLRSFEMRRLGGSLAICPSWPLTGRVAGAVCAGLDGGALRTTGTGFDSSVASDQFVAEGRLTGRLELALWGRLSGQIGLGLQVPLVRPRVSYSSSPAVSGGGRADVEVYRTSSVGWLGEIGFTVQLGELPSSSSPPNVVPPVREEPGAARR